MLIYVFVIAAGTLNAVQSGSITQLVRSLERRWLVGLIVMLVNRFCTGTCRNASFWTAALTSTGNLCFNLVVLTPGERAELAQTPDKSPILAISLFARHWVMIDAGGRCSLARDPFDYAGLSRSVD